MRCSSTSATDNEKALAVQNIVEGCSARFESQVLFVATGQSALTATPTLQKLTDRFAVQVALSDKDVETVVRQVILRKQPEQNRRRSSTPRRGRAAEIDRQLGGTQLAAKAADKQDLVPDYPLLPTRRRFWELVLRAIDRAGKAGVLRTQLKIVHEAARDVAVATTRSCRRWRLRLRAAISRHAAERRPAQGNR